MEVFANLEGSRTSPKRHGGGHRKMPVHPEKKVISPVVTRIKMESKREEKRYHVTCVAAIKEEIGVLEEAILKKRKIVVNQHIDKDFEDRFSNSSFSRNKNTKIFKATEHY
jgi:hypothetical protein